MATGIDADLALCIPEWEWEEEGGEELRCWLHDVEVMSSSFCSEYMEWASSNWRRKESVKSMR